MKLTRFAVPSAVKNTHVDNQFPSEICITYPPHPLCGKRLKVVGRRSKEKNILWRVVLPDGSRTYIPSSWTDHSVQVPSSVSSVWIKRTTPKALREFIALVETLVSRTSSCKACSEIIFEGGKNERADGAFRDSKECLGAKCVEVGRPAVEERGDQRVSADGKSPVRSRKDPKRKVEKGGTS